MRVQKETAMAHGNEWVLDKNGNRLFRVRIMDNRKLVFDRAGHYEGMTRRLGDDREFSRDAAGHTLFRGSHPDLIHDNAKREKEKP